MSIRIVTELGNYLNICELLFRFDIRARTIFIGEEFARKIKLAKASPPFIVIESIVRANFISNRLSC